MTTAQTQVLVYLATVIAADVQDISEDTGISVPAATNTIRNLIKTNHVIIAMPRADVSLGNKTIAGPPLYARRPE